jgi:hypothetical protein
VHRSWDAMGDARSESRRASSGTKVGLVHKVCELLVDAGLLRKASEDEGGTYRTTPRLTLMVRSMVTDSDLYADLLAATARVGAEADPGDEGTDGNRTDGDRTDSDETGGPV